MKAKHVLQFLLKIDPETEVGTLGDNRVTYADTVGVYDVDFYNRYGNKMIVRKTRCNVFAIGNPGNYEELCYHDVCKPIQVEEF